MISGIHISVCLRKNMKILLIPCLAILVVSCNNPAETTVDAGADSSGTVAVIPEQGSTVQATDTSLSGCYAYEGGKDTVLLQLENKSGTVSGSLSFNYYEKDRNDGTLQGTLSGDKITGFYLFRSEGMMSVRQEIWKVVGNRLVPGTGEVIQRNDSTFFRDPAAVKFDEARALNKKPCTT